MKIFRPAILLNLIYICFLLITIDYVFISPYLIDDVSKYGLLINVKSYLVENSNVFSGVYKSFINSLVLGERLYGYTKDVMISIGVYHIMSLSGLHIGILYGILDKLLALMKNQYLKFIIIAFSLIFYGCLTGLKVATLRAIIMCIIMLFGQLINRKNDTLNTLSIASLLVLIYDSRLVYSVSYILSFTMVAGIIIYGKIIVRIFDDIFTNKRVSKGFLQYLNIAISSYFVSLPLTLHFFGEANLLSILANIAIVFIVPLIFLFGLITLVFGTSLFVNITCLLIDYVIKVSEYLNSFGLKITSSEFTMVHVVITYILIYLLLFMILKVLKRKREVWRV